MKHLIILAVTFSLFSAQAQIPTDSLKGYYTFNGVYTDYSGQSNNILSGSGTFVEDRFGNSNEALLLDGISDSLVLPIPEFSPISGDFTISFWYKTSSPYIMNCFSSKQSPNDTTNNFEIQLSSHNSYYLQYLQQSFYQTFVYWNGTGLNTNAIAEGTPGAFTYGEWCHFIITREADTLRIFRNHVLYTLSIDNLYSGSLGDAVDLIFSAAPYRFKGSIDDVRLYNRSLDQGEIDFLWFEKNPFSIITVKPTDAYVQGSNVLVYWEYDTLQISDSILVEYRINGGPWIAAVHTNMAYESYTYLNMTYAPGTTVEARVSDFTNPLLTQSTGALLVSEYEWTEVASTLPFNAKDGAGLVNFQNKMWLLGGWDPPYHPPNYTHSEIWSSTDGANWTFETTAPWPGRHCSAWLASDSAIWVIGGDPQSGCLTDVWKSTDGINWTQTTSAIPGYVLRNNPNYAYANGQIFVYGGEQCSGNPLNDVWSSIVGITWTQLPNAPWSGRGMQVNSCVDGSGQIWMLSGSNEGTRRSFNEVWKTADGITWTLVNESAPWRGRLWHTVAWFDNKMWLMGGLATGAEMNDVWYSEDGINWHELKSTAGNEPANTRHAQSTTVFDNALWYMCGIASNNAWKITNTTTMSGVNTTGTETFGLKLSPNPALENVVVSFTSSNNKKHTIQVYNMLGSLVYEMEHTCIDSRCSASIDISEIPAGVYFVQVKNQPGLIAKIIKQ
ncbi:MAG: T9SS type A sorting domain-containing protein [Bacteroidetes bacterium]|nr:T9SS type A sorting domain-containing protein [Bacteroidota bacterium]